MKKVTIGVLSITALISGLPAFAAHKIGLAIDQDFGVALQITDVNQLTGNEVVSDDYINLFVGNDGFSFDYIFKQGSFSEQVPFNWYVGAGAYYNWAQHDNIGTRVPLGITLPFANKWDLYGQLAPTLDSDLDKNNLRFELDFAIGVRYAF